MKTRIKERSFYHKHYDCNISYLIGGSVHQLKSFIEKRHKDIPLYSWGTLFQWGEDADTTDAYQFHTADPFHINSVGHGETFYVWLAELSPRLLAHETLHLVGDILYNRGFKYSYSSEEAWAYLQGDLFEEIFKLLGGSFKQNK